MRYASTLMALSWSYCAFGPDMISWLQEDKIRFGVCERDKLEIDKERRNLKYVTYVYQSDE